MKKKYIHNPLRHFPPALRSDNFEGMSPFYQDNVLTYTIHQGYVAKAKREGKADQERV